MSATTLPPPPKSCSPLTAILTSLHPGSGTLVALAHAFSGAYLLERTLRPCLVELVLNGQADHFFFPCSSFFFPRVVTPLSFLVE